MQEWENVTIAQLVRIGIEQSLIAVFRLGWVEYQTFLWY